MYYYMLKLKILLITLIKILKNEKKKKTIILYNKNSNILKIQYKLCIKFFYIILIKDFKIKNFN